MISSTHQATTLTDILSHLVRMPTVSTDHATNRAALDWVQEQLHGLPLEFKTLTHKGVSSLVGTTPAVKNPLKPRLWLSGHIDVVPGTPEEFKPVIKDGRIIGRGVFDMKYAIAIFIKLLREIGEDLADYDLGLMLVSDEELSGYDGAKYLSSLGYAGKAMLLPECGSPWDFETGSKGITWYKITANGLSGHAARPWKGFNAIDRLSDFLTALRQQFPTEPCGDDKHMHNTVNVGTISGGATTNQIPGIAEATIDVRMTPDFKEDQLRELLAELAAQAPGIRLKELASNPAVQLPFNGPAKLFEKITHDITGRKLGRSFAHASSDARFFAANGIEVITVPTTGGGQHSPEEWIDIEDLASYYEIVERFVKEFAGPRAKTA